MALQIGRQNKVIDFSDMTGGVVNAFPPHSLDENQVADALNLIFEKRGCTRAPGMVGISVAALFAGPIRGFWSMLKSDGTESYIVAAELKLWSVDLSAGTRTQIGTLSNDNECRGVVTWGKLWIVNGTDAFKVESDLSVKRIGIVAPTGWTASGTAVAGTLPAGAYDAYGCYARKISGTIVLYSAPFHITSSPVTVDGNHAMRFAVTASTDTQVTDIVIWMTAAGGSTLYYYWDAANTTGNIDVINETQKNVALLMYELAAGNQLPSALAGIYAFNGRLLGWKANDNDLKYTLQAQNVYDLEKWSTEFHIPTIPYNIVSCHTVGSNLYVNTVGGFYVFENGDLSAKPLPVTQGAQTPILYFPLVNVGTIVEHNGKLFGLTNDGWRSFDGTNFSVDLSQRIKPIMDTIALTAANFPPRAVIYRRPGKRTEYRLSYQDNTIGTTCHNRQIVLNMDRLTIITNQFQQASPTQFSAPWEIWSPGFSHAIVTNEGKIYFGQSSASAGVIASEYGKGDKYVLNSAGVYLSDLIAKAMLLKTRTEIDELAGQNIIFTMYYLCRLMADIAGKIWITDQDNYFEGIDIKKTGGSAPDIVTDTNPQLILPFILTADNPQQGKQKFSPDIKGNSVFVELSQTALDDNFALNVLQLYVILERNLFT
jgi:hypothetical protein